MNKWTDGPISFTVGLYTFTWHGGEYIEVSRDGVPFDVINTTDRNGELSEFGPQTLGRLVAETAISHGGHVQYMQDLNYYWNESQR